MKNYLVNRASYHQSFAEHTYRRFMEDAYGIKTKDHAMIRSRILTDIDLAYMRKELADWQANEDNDALSQTTYTFTTWKPIGYEDDPDALNTSGLFSLSHNPNEPSIVRVNYNYGNGEGNILEVNTGGCITRINLNPAITIDPSVANSYLFTQSVAATVWTIVHNLSFTPNVTTEDSLGEDIEGIIEIIDATTLTITFSEAVAGKAYLS